MAPPRGDLYFAGLKSVADSAACRSTTSTPMSTARSNCSGPMDEAAIRTIIFSSSATVYGAPDSAPVPEDAAKRVANPYGRSKLMAEEVLEDLATSDPRWRIARLRYFNPVGAHPSGLMGEDPRGHAQQSHALHRAGGGRPARAAGDLRRRLSDPRRDRCPRLHPRHGPRRGPPRGARIPAPDAGADQPQPRDGIGLTVREVLAAFERASGVTIPVEIVPRRPGDVAECYADPALAARRLGWSSRWSLDEMCVDAWRWQSHNPDGYGS